MDFAGRLRDAGSKRLAFVIAGADGFTDAVKSSARWQLNLLPVTFFPHEPVRPLFLEQLCRAQSILKASPVHRA